MRTVVSLSTIPSRVEYLNQIVQCLKKQTYEVDRIYINLPKWSHRENIAYPDVEDTLTQDPQVCVVHCEDHGPITKLYPILTHETDPETLIITVDDDIEYIPERVALLVKWAQLYPNVAIGGSGFILGKWWNFFGTIRMPKEITAVDVIEGYSGCAYRRKFFDEDLIDYTGAPKEAFYHDDVWISGYLAKRNIGRVVHPLHENALKVGNSGYGKEERLPGALSESLINFIWKILPVLWYFQRNNIFQEEQKTAFYYTIGFWVLISIILVLLLLVYLITR